MAKLFLARSWASRAQRSAALTRFLMRLEGLLIAVSWWLLKHLPPDLASAIGRRIIGLVGPRVVKHGKIKNNLAIAFPDLRPDEVEQLARGVWGNLGAVIGEYPHLETICAHEADSRLEIVTHEKVKALQRAGKPVVFVGAHLGNWEVAAPTGVRLGFRMLLVYSPQQNPWIERLVRDRREALGLELVTKEQAMRSLMQQLREGGSVGMLTDQRVDSGEPVPFLGHNMWTTVIPARLALKFGCALVPARVERLQGARFRVTVHEPIRLDEQAADDKAQVLHMTRQVNALFEAWIREKPEQWTCTKRRWPKHLVPSWLK